MMLLSNQTFLHRLECDEGPIEFRGAEVILNQLIVTLLVPPLH